MNAILIFVYVDHEFFDHQKMMKKAMKITQEEDEEREEHIVI